VQDEAERAGQIRRQGDDLAVDIESFLATDHVGLERLSFLAAAFSLGSAYLKSPSIPTQCKGFEFLWTRRWLAADGLQRFRLAAAPESFVSAKGDEPSRDGQGPLAARRARLRGGGAAAPRPLVFHRSLQLG
jgi:hypothetical protein